MPLISVIVPVYKVEPYLHQCVDSILNQTFKDFELILVDDGSPDNCPAICDEYAKKDNRVIVIHKENGGQSSARNAGLDYVFANSNSEYISFVDSDDYVDVRYLECLYNNVGDCEICMCNFSYIYDNKAVNPPSLNSKRIAINSDNFWDYSWPNLTYPIVPFNKLYKKEIFKKIRYPIGKIFEDSLIIHEVVEACNKMFLLNEPLYYYRQRSGSTMQTIDYDSINYDYSLIEILFNRLLYYIDANKAKQICLVYNEYIARVVNFYKKHRHLKKINISIARRAVFCLFKLKYRVSNKQLFVLLFGKAGVYLYCFKLTFFGK